MNTSGFRDNTARKDQRRVPGMLLAGYLVVWVVTAIHPLYWHDWLVENLLVFIGLPALILTSRRFPFSNLSYVLFTVFFTLHSIGAHYTYSEVPIGNWIRDAYGLSRNHYDRVIHFLFGALLARPFWEILHRAGRLPRGWACVAAVHVIVAWSGLYEILEAVVAQNVSPDLGAAYTGGQGDIWDAQKDEGLAMAGAILTSLLIGLTGRRMPPS